MEHTFSAQHDRIASLPPAYTPFGKDPLKLAPPGVTIPSKGPAYDSAVDRKFAKLVDVVTSRQIAGQTVGDRRIFDWAQDPATYSLFPAD
jgi:hypothetical protein